MLYSGYAATQSDLAGVNGSVWIFFFFFLHLLYIKAIYEIDNYTAGTLPHFGFSGAMWQMWKTGAGEVENACMSKNLTYIRPQN